MTLQFAGTLKYRFRLSLFGHDIFAGPWKTQSVHVSVPVPPVGASISLPDGFSASIGEEAGNMSLAIKWEGLQIFTESIPATGSIPVSLQPLKGLILTGTASLAQ